MQVRKKFRVKLVDKCVYWVRLRGGEIFDLGVRKSEKRKVES